MSEVSFSPESIEQLKEYLQEKPKTIILIHANPDGDTLGSGWALYQGLKSQGIDVHIACKDPVPESFHFLGAQKEIRLDFNEDDYETVFFLDCGDKRMTRFQEDKSKILSSEMQKVNIDHHPTNDNFGDINFVCIKAASTTQIIYELLRLMKIPITSNMATSLLLGLYTDTGAFMHQNTTPETYRVSGELMKLGANISRISKNIFRSYDLKTLKLWGRVLQNVSLTPDGAAVVGIPREEYESFGAKREDLAGVIDFVNAMPEAQYTVLLSEDEKGNVKASLRTRKDDVDVKALAEQFGGGGHVKASGFTIKGGHLEKEVKWKIIV